MDARGYVIQASATVPRGTEGRMLPLHIQA